MTARTERPSTTIKTDRGEQDVIDLLQRNVKSVRMEISPGQYRSIPVAAIPVSAYHLECGCSGQALAVRVGNAFYCDKHDEIKTVVKVRN